MAIQIICKRDIQKNDPRMFSQECRYLFEVYSFGDQPLSSHIKCCPLNALIYYEQNICNAGTDPVGESSGQGSQLVNKVKQMTNPHEFPILPAHVLDGLIHLLEKFEAEQNPQDQYYTQKKRELKFYARTIYLALAIRCGDGVASPHMVTAIEDSSYFLAHKCCFNSSDFSQFQSTGDMVIQGHYFLSQQHIHFETSLFLMLGAEGKVSTPFDFAQIMVANLGASTFLGLLNCLIDFALTIPETAQLSSQQVFVGCCLLAAEKVNSHSLSGFLLGNFEGALGKGGQLKELIKELFESINSDT